MSFTRPTTRPTASVAGLTVWIHCNPHWTAKGHPAVFRVLLDIQVFSKFVCAGVCVRAHACVFVRGVYVSLCVSVSGVFV